MKVDTDNCRTAEEELEYIMQQYERIGDFFVCDVHPNQIRACDITSRRLLQKRKALLCSEEYLYETNKLNP